MPLDAVLGGGLQVLVEFGEARNVLAQVSGERAERRDVLETRGLRPVMRGLRLAFLDRLAAFASYETQEWGAWPC